MKDNKHHDFVLWLIVVLVAITAAAFFVFPNGGGQEYVSQTSTGQPNPNAPTYSPTGQVAGLPAELGFSQNQTSSNYGMSYSATTNQYTAEWDSSSSMITLFNDYKTYLTSNGWTITNQTSLNGLYGLYASNPSSTVNVAITPDGNGGSNVDLSYTTQ